MVVSGTRSFEGTSPVSRYWLARCEGFTVCSGRRVLGAVAEIGGPDPFGTAEYLVVRRRPALRRDRTLILAERVTEVIPARRLLVVDAAPRAVAVRARRVVRAARTATPVAVSLARVTAALLGAVLRFTLLLLVLSARLLLRLAAELHGRLPDALAAVRRGLAATLRLLARLARAVRTGAHALGARAGPALAELRAKKAE
jgi:hypothetical protein